MCRKLSILFLLLQVWLLPAQMPDTEIWLFKLEKSKSGQTLKDPQNISKRPGYDNQPSFSTDGKKLFYVSVREDKQADIYYYDLGKKKNVQLTKTALSEYSPSETADGKQLSAVVVESDSSQSIHFINATSGVHEKKIELDSVGYYTF